MVRESSSRRARRRAASARANCPIAWGRTALAICQTFDLDLAAGTEGQAAHAIPFRLVVPAETRPATRPRYAPPSGATPGQHPTPPVGKSPSCAARSVKPCAASPTVSGLRPRGDAQRRRSPARAKLWRSGSARWRGKPARVEAGAQLAPGKRHGHRRARPGARR